MTTLYQPASPDAIDKCIARLAVAFQRQIDAATVRIYRETMSDLPLWAIEAGELQLRRTGGSFFPSAPDWHAAAQQAIADQQRMIMAEVRVGEEFCGRCRDTGMRESSPDRYTHCECRLANPNYQRTRGRDVTRA